jgi:hypothetical protein
MSGVTEADFPASAPAELEVTPQSIGTITVQMRTRLDMIRLLLLRSLARHRCRLSPSDIGEAAGYLLIH